MIRGLILTVFVAIFVLLIAVGVYMIIKGIYGLLRQARREDLMDDRVTHRDLYDDENWPTRL